MKFQEVLASRLPTPMSQSNAQDLHSILKALELIHQDNLKLIDCKEHELTLKQRELALKERELDWSRRTFR